MNRTLRGALARRGPLTVLAATATLVVAGVVAILGFAAEAEASPLLSAPLLVLAVVAVYVTGTELAAARREEIGVARLRGLRGRPLLRMMSAEPLLAVGAGAVVGYLVGLVGTRVTTARWTEGGVWWAGWTPTVVAVGVVVGAVGVVLAGTAATLREPLTDQVSIAARPRSAGTWAVFGSLLVLVLGGLTVYRAGVTGAGDPDWVLLFGPVLVGLAAGQLAVWLLTGLAKVAARSSGPGRLAPYLAVRHLRNAAGFAHPLRLLVAAAVVAIVALSAAARIGAWGDDTARMRAGAELQLPFAGGAVGALHATRVADPEGRWLMAAAAVQGGTAPEERRTYVDTARYDDVVGDFLDGTPAAGVAGLLDRVTPTPVDPGVSTVSGDTLELVPGSAGAVPRLEVQYLADTGALASAAVGGGRAADPGPIEARLPECGGGCLVTGIGVRSRPGADSALVTALRVGESDLLEQAWVPEPLGEAFPGPNGLRVVPGADTTLVPRGGALPVLLTDAVPWPGSGEVKTPGGMLRPARPVGRVPALPLTERVGVLVDLPRALAGDAPTVPVADVVVLARADTPAQVLRDARDLGAGAPLSYQDLETDILTETGAQQARAFALIGLVCLLVAALALAGSFSRRRAARIEELAVLRLLGLPQRRAGRSTWVEAVLLAGTTVLAAGSAGLVATRALLPVLPLVREGEYAVPLVAEVPPLVPLLVAAVAVGLLLLWGARLSMVSPQATRPAALREEAG